LYFGSVSFDHQGIVAKRRDKPYQALQVMASILMDENQPVLEIAPL
jgi:hypothetical protein